MIPLPALDRWEKRTEWPLAAVAASFLAVYSVQVLDQPHGTLAQALSLLTTIAYLVFVVDYVARLALAPQRRRWFFRHFFDLAIVALPLLRPLRLIRLVLLVVALQKAVGGAIRGRVVIYTATSAVLLIYVASLAALEAERVRPGASITNFGDALWWSITTMTTVGYGDFTPVTATGRGVAVVLMLGGISLLGIVTATLASWIVQRVAEEDTANQAATRAEIDQLRGQVEALTELISQRLPAQPRAARPSRRSLHPSLRVRRSGYVDVGDHRPPRHRVSLRRLNG
jgi:voltage-gated potassium channel